MKTKINRQAQRILSNHEHDVDLRLLLRNVDMYVANNEHRSDDALKVLLKHNDVELASLLKIAIVVFNKKLTEFDFSSEELQLMINHLNKQYE